MSGNGVCIFIQMIILNNLCRLTFGFSGLSIYSLFLLFLLVVAPVTVFLIVIVVGLWIVLLVFVLKIVLVKDFRSLLVHGRGGAGANLQIVEYLRRVTGHPAEGICFIPEVVLTEPLGRERGRGDRGGELVPFFADVTGDPLDLLDDGSRGGNESGVGD